MAQPLFNENEDDLLHQVELLALEHAIVPNTPLTGIEISEKDQGHTDKEAIPL